MRIGLTVNPVDSPLIDYVAAYMFKLPAEHQEAALFVLDDMAAAVVQMRFGLVSGRRRNDRDIAKELGLRAGVVRDMVLDSVEKLVTALEIDVDEALA